MTKDGPPQEYRQYCLKDISRLAISMFSLYISEHRLLTNRERLNSVIHVVYKSGPG